MKPYWGHFPTANPSPPAQATRARNRWPCPPRRRAMPGWLSLPIPIVRCWNRVRRPTARRSTRRHSVSRTTQSAANQHADRQCGHAHSLYRDCPNTLTDQPVPNVPVAVLTHIAGTMRTVSATTDANGNFTATFQPLATETGVYQYTAGLPGSTGCAAWTIRDRGHDGRQRTDAERGTRRAAVRAVQR